MKPAINDEVELLYYVMGTPNRFARVVAIVEDGIVVSNMSQPYCGTLANKLILHGEFRAVKGWGAL